MISSPKRVMPSAPIDWFVMSRICRFIAPLFRNGISICPKVCFIEPSLWMNKRSSSVNLGIAARKAFKPVGESDTSIELLRLKETKSGCLSKNLTNNKVWAESIRLLSNEKIFSPVIVASESSYNTA